MGYLDMAKLEQYLGKEGVRIFLKCSDCNNFAEIEALKVKLLAVDERFKSLESGLESFENGLEKNTTLTQETSEILKNMHNKMFIDTPGAKSIQSLMIISSEKQSNMTAIVVFLIVSIAGIAFTVITNSMPKRDMPTDQPILYAVPSREHISIEKGK